MSRNVQLVSDGQITRKTSLAELRAHVLADETLPEVRRGEMASALRSLAKALGRPRPSQPIPRRCGRRSRGSPPPWSG
jgi:hypothetical protein